MTFWEVFYKKGGTSKTSAIKRPSRSCENKLAIRPKNLIRIPCMKKISLWVALFCLWTTAVTAEPAPADPPRTYAHQSAAENAASLLKDKGLDAYVTTNQRGLHVVRAGNHASRVEAKQEAARLKAEHIIDSFLVVSTRTSVPVDAAETAQENIPDETPVVQDSPPADIKPVVIVPSEAAAPAEIRNLPAKSKHEGVAEKTSTRAQVVAALEAMANQPMAPHPPGFRAAQIALDYIGVKYRWGGMSVEKGMDCSGFVKTVYALCGINLPRTSAEQYRQGKPVKSNELTAGDMVFFGTNKRVNHVGIYLGEGKIIHAPRAKDKIKISSMEEGALGRKFLGARRLLFGE
jgi:cell wall-associated NlpC family hydrolase